MWTHLRSAAEGSQRQTRAGFAIIRGIRENLGVDLAAYPSHGVNPRIPHSNASRTASTAGPKALLFGRLRQGEENHLFAPWPSRRARWPAVNASRAHGVNKH